MKEDCDRGSEDGDNLQLVRCFARFAGGLLCKIWNWSYEKSSSKVGVSVKMASDRRLNWMKKRLHYWNHVTIHRC